MDFWNDVRQRSGNRKIASHKTSSHTSDINIASIIRKEELKFQQCIFILWLGKSSIYEKPDIPATFFCRPCYNIQLSKSKHADEVLGSNQGVEKIRKKVFLFLSLNCRQVDVTRPKKIGSWNMRRQRGSYGRNIGGAENFRARWRAIFGGADSPSAPLRSQLLGGLQPPQPPL